MDCAGEAGVPEGRKTGVSLSVGSKPANLLASPWTGAVEGWKDGVFTLNFRLSEVGAVATDFTGVAPGPRLAFLFLLWLNAHPLFSYLQ